MRTLMLAMAFFTSSSWAVSASNTIEQLTSQLAPVWQAIKPSCVMALDLETQQGVMPRIAFLDRQLIASHLTAHLQPLAEDNHPAWSNQAWAIREQLERSALSLEDRESLREYFFKLQTQTPNAGRAKLVAEVQHMSEQLNITLRKELWKTCHALGFHSMPQVQMEAAVDQRWLKQSKKVSKQLNKELAAFYFYSLRQVENLELAVLAKTATELNPWVASTVQSIEAYFYQLRGNLLTTALADKAANSSVSEPFPASRPWHPVPSQGPFQP